ncbi:hypothetical protein V8C34DRAFT_288796 [Trichoderma compactum]
MPVTLSWSHPIQSNGLNPRPLIRPGYPSYMVAFPWLGRFFHWLAGAATRTWWTCLISLLAFALLAFALFPRLFFRRVRLTV